MTQSAAELSLYAEIFSDPRQRALSCALHSESKAMSNPSQLFLLADHIKLSLLDRQRTDMLLLGSTSLNADVSTSLNTLQDGITALEADTASQSEIHRSQVFELRQQYNSLLAQYQNESTQKNVTPVEPDDNTSRLPSPDNLKPSAKSADEYSKIVRFTDRATQSDSVKRYALMPYKDDPEDTNEIEDQSNWDNQEIHSYHKTVLRNQDEQLDRLGTSIGRQRELSIQIGSELDDQADVLDDIDERVTRHQGQLDRAKTRLGRFAKKAKDNLSLTIIAILVMILILLLIILK